MGNCMGKAFSVKKDKGADDETEPKLVNKVEHNSSFKDADKAKAAANGEANGKTRKESSSSSSSSSDDAGEADDKVGSYHRGTLLYFDSTSCWVCALLCVLVDTLNCSKHSLYIYQRRLVCHQPITELKWCRKHGALARCPRYSSSYICPLKFSRSDKRTCFPSDA